MSEEKKKRKDKEKEERKGREDRATWGKITVASFQ